MKQLSLLLLLLVAPVMADELPGDAQYAVFMGDNGVIVLRLDIQIGGKSPRGSYERYVDDLMKSLDKDQDGVVTVEEAKGKYLTASETLKPYFGYALGNYIMKFHEANHNDKPIILIEIGCGMCKLLFNFRWTG